MNENYFFALAFGIGVVAGLRSLMAPAVVAWAAHLGWLQLHGSRLSFVGSTAAVAIFSLLATGELIADKLPKTPRRTAIVGLVARISTGAFCGACFSAAANSSLLAGSLLGAIGAVTGAFAGYEVRRRLVAALNVKDFLVAVVEDLVAIGLALFLVSR